ncbi:hypothetical protein CPCC7001_672 [Cyanobium sp. PCC 7001]|uniref:hypothetical protein n=1 Tax=Cyanobium sp. PCC 7001 TaxID=180281 RepID=UPI0001804B1A|nr:hypothetical protein [Cyanobium sp. PCC 7001]EDY37793.1 hypothetical protein CPCC7001_672 [Cyanobium sp. PCC 7001]
MSVPDLLIRFAAAAGAPAAGPQWLLPRSLFNLVVVGSIAGLVLATLVILTIWAIELRGGKVW